MLCNGPLNSNCIYCAENMIKVGLTTCTDNPNNCNIYGGDSIHPVSKACQPCAVANCLTCSPNNFCSYCENGYYANSAGACVVCPVGTLYCAQLSGKSLACQAGYIFSETSNCMPACETNKYLQDTSCVACNANCLSCATNKDYCTDCRPGDFLYGKAIDYTFKRPCNVLANTALQGYYGPGPSPCPFPCLTCSSAAVCLSCYRGYYLAVSSCLKCTPPCYDCETSPTHCTSCHIGFKLESNNTCSHICEDYEYFDTGGSTLHEVHISMQELFRSP
jgi:hypothetical protein